jgi:hypothetical protein
MLSRATTASAQDITAAPAAAAADDTIDSAADRFLEGSIGYSWYSPQARFLGAAGFRRVYLSELRMEWVWRDSRLAYAASFIPIAVVERTTGPRVDCRIEGDEGEVCRSDRSARVAVGTGLTPFGFKMFLLRADKLRVYGSAGAGFLVFSSAVPVYNSRRFNFTFEYGGGVEVPYASGGAVTIGYKFHHLSNAFTVPTNPGLDANVIYVGMRRQLHGQ